MNGRVAVIYWPCSIIHLRYTVLYCILAVYRTTSCSQNLFPPTFSPRIKEKPSAVVCPVIDVIDWNTFQYLGNSGEPQIGGFDWRLVFTWHTIPEAEQKRRSSPTDVIRCV